MIEATILGFITIGFLVVVTARLIEFCEKYAAIGWMAGFVIGGFVFLISHLVGLGVMSLFGW
jgi:hypothetical protein